MKVLLIDSDIVLAQITQRYLERYEHTTHIAYDAQTAVGIADTHTPDVIVLEPHMPKNNGVAFLQELRSHADWLKIPVIISSAVSAEETAVPMSVWDRFGVSAYLYKPVTSLDLLRRQLEAIRATT